MLSTMDNTMSLFMYYNVSEILSGVADLYIEQQIYPLLRYIYT